MQELDMDVSLKVIIVGNGMVGKCWGVGTQIIMADGSFKTVEKIQSGDLLMGDDGTYRTVQPGSIHRGNTQRDAQLLMAGDNDSTLQRSMVDGQFQWTTKQSSPSIAPAMYRITSNNKSRDSFTCNGDHILVLSFDTAPSAIEQESTDSFVFHQLRFENGLVHRQTNRFSTRASAELAHSSAIDSHQPFVWECSINDFLQCDEYVRSCACMFQPNEPIAFHPTGQLSLQQRLSAAMGVEATQQQAQEMAWSLGLWLSLGSGMESTSPSVVARLSSCYRSVGGPVMMQRLLESYHLIDGGKIAHDLLTESIDIRMKLVAGLVDACQSYDVTCQSSVMCDGVLHLARGLGLSASIQSAAVVAISGRNLDRLALTHRPAGAVPHQPLANTFTIDKVDHADYYGFTLDGNGRCLLGSFIITHNTSMITRFARGIATDNYKKTIGTDFMEKEITTRRTGETIKLMLWDTAGQEMFSQLTRNYYRGAGAVVFVFSTTDRDSFLEIERWKSKVEAECGQICQVLVQNKIDLLEKAQMTSQEVEDLARRMGIKLYRTCVKDNVLVDEVFDYLADSFLKQGGSSAFGVESVTNIGDLNTNTSATGSSSSSSSAVSSSPLVGPTGPGSSKSNEKPNNAPSSEKAQSSAPFQLTPLTVRTDGKKKSMCTIL